MAGRIICRFRDAKILPFPHSTLYEMYHTVDRVKKTERAGEIVETTAIYQNNPNSNDVAMRLK